jgi:hypothetical protein
MSIVTRLLNVTSNQYDKIDRECMICMDDEKGLPEEVLSCECSNYYHKECIKKWRTRNNTCPTCRKEIHSVKRVKLFSIQELLHVHDTWRYNSQLKLEDRQYINTMIEGFLQQDDIWDNQERKDVQTGISTILTEITQVNNNRLRCIEDRAQQNLPSLKEREDSVRRNKQPYLEEDYKRVLKELEDRIQHNKQPYLEEDHKRVLKELEDRAIEQKYRQRRYDGYVKSREEHRRVQEIRDCQLYKKYVQLRKKRKEDEYNNKITQIRRENDIRLDQIRQQNKIRLKLLNERQKIQLVRNKWNNSQLI